MYINQSWYYRGGGKPSNNNMTFHRRFFFFCGCFPYKILFRMDMLKKEKLSDAFRFSECVSIVLYNTHARAMKWWPTLWKQLTILPRETIGGHHPVTIIHNAEKRLNLSRRLTHNHTHTFVRQPNTIQVAIWKNEAQHSRMSVAFP